MSEYPYLALTGNAPKSHATTPLARMLRQYRDMHRMSQTRFAEYLDFDHSYISRVESGTRTIHPDNIPMLAERLQIDEAHLALAICGIDPDAYEQSIRDDERSRIVQEITKEAA